MGFSDETNSNSVSSAINSIAVGRDLICSLNKKEPCPDCPKIDIKKYFDVFDRRANECLQGRIVNAARVAKPEEFSSIRLISSLCHVGIPFDICICLVEGVVSGIEACEKIENFSVSDIRRIVRDEIYNISIASCSREEVRAWGDRYSRQYGNPDRQIQIVMGDGVVKDFNYSFMQKELVPDVVSRSFEWDKIKPFISDREMDAIAKKILVHVSGLHLYSIRYDVLLDLCVELAVQPPHPWFAEKHREDVVIIYDEERKQSHLKKILELYQTNELELFLRHVREFVRHTCSSLLAFYRVLIGCNQMSPLSNLINSLSKLSSNEELRDGAKSGCAHYLELYPRLASIEVDLEKAGSSVRKFEKLLGKTREALYYQPMSGEQKGLKANSLVLSKIPKLSELFSHIEELDKISGSILEKYIFLMSIKEADVTNLTEGKFTKLIVDFFKSIPSGRVRHKNGNLWFSHDLQKGVFKHIQDLMICPVYSMPTPPEGIDLFLSKVAISEQNHFGNTILFVTRHSVSADFLSSLEKGLVTNRYIIVLSLSDILSIIEQNALDDIDRLQTLFWDKTVDRK